MTEDKPRRRINPDRSALLVTSDGSYHHNLSLVAEKVSRITSIPAKQAYIFLRRFANDSAGGQIHGINKKIARELGLKKWTAYISASFRNIHRTFPEVSTIRKKATRKDFKTSVLSKAHQAVLTLMFIKTVDPDMDMAKIQAECKEIFDQYLPDVSMIANGDLTIVDSKEEEEENEHS